MGLIPLRDPDKEIILKAQYEALKPQALAKRITTYGKGAKRIWRRGAFIGHKLFYFKQAIRTMELAKEYVTTTSKKGQVPYSGTVFMAETLLRAKGRYTRKWFAPKGGLWFSLLIYPEVDTPYIYLYPLVAGIACCEALREIGVKATLKWINDLLYNGRKIGGILTETFFSPQKDPYLILGIGINLNNTLPTFLKNTAISAKEITGKEIDIDLFFCFTLLKLIWYIGLLHEAEIQKNTKGIIDIWRQYTDSLGRKAIYGEDLTKEKGEEVEILGINPYGGLILRFSKTQEVQTVYSGELIYC